MELNFQLELFRPQITLCATGFFSRGVAATVSGETAIEITASEKNTPSGLFFYRYFFLRSQRS